MKLWDLLNAITVDTPVVVLKPDKRSIEMSDIPNYGNNHVSEVTANDDMIFILIKEEN